MLPRKVSSIDEAIKIIGLRGLRAVIESYGTKVILDNRFGKMEALWQHAYRVAFYSQELAKNRRLDKTMLEDIFLGGLLHDLGKIVISSMHPELQERIRKICIDKNLKGAVLEDLAMGITHAKVGALLAEKWNFPDILVKAIDYHHDPIFADDENHPIVYTVYLANAFAMIEIGEFRADQLDKNVLDFFNLKDEKDISTVSLRLKQLYERRRATFDS
jgi:putative nucleotidyltransferase with HDIG domain